MPMWRCLNCRKEFEAAQPACAECELDPATRARDANYFVAVVTVHYDPPTKVEGRGYGYAACDRKLYVGSGGAAYSGDPAAVTCARCKETKEYKNSGGKASGVIDRTLEKRE